MTSPVSLPLTLAEVATVTGIRIQTLRIRCREGHVPGAVKVAGQWMVPAKSAIELPPVRVQHHGTPAVHGTRARYTGYGCRCVPCVDANAAYEHARRVALRQAV